MRESNLMNPRCQKLSELDAKTAEMDKEWYAKRDSKTDEPAKIAKIYVTVYYAEKGEQKLHHFKKSMDIGNGHGGIVSQLKYNNEMKLTDELGTSTKANAVVKDAGKADRKPVQQKQAAAGKDKPDRGDDLGVRTVQNKHNESEVTNDNVASGFFGLE